MDELKPCPLCGSTDIEIRRSRGYGTGRHVSAYSYSAICHGCRAQMAWVPDEEEAIKMWNWRGKPHPPTFP